MAINRRSRIGDDGTYSIHSSLFVEMYNIQVYRIYTSLKHEHIRPFLKVYIALRAPLMIDSPRE